MLTLYLIALAAVKGKKILQGMEKKLSTPLRIESFNQETNQAPRSPKKQRPFGLCLCTALAIIHAGYLELSLSLLCAPVAYSCPGRGLCRTHPQSSRPQPGCGHGFGVQSVPLPCGEPPATSTQNPGSTSSQDPSMKLTTVVRNQA
jgi:hypothetical protein